MTADDLNTLRDEVAEVLAEHRVNYHHRNVGPEPVTADNLRYTSCEGCDWLGGHRDEAGWEAHLADALLPLLARRIEAARAEALERITRAEEDANRAIDRRREAYTEGLAEGEARVRARVEAFTGGPLSDGYRPYAIEIDGEIHLAVLLDDLRAALAESTGREGEQ